MAKSLWNLTITPFHTSTNCCHKVGITQLSSLYTVAFQFPFPGTKALETLETFQ